MKLKILLCAGLLTCVSCANQTSPLFIENFFPLEPGCLIPEDETLITTWGYLDVAAGSPQFFIGMQLSGGEGIIQPPLRVGQAQLEAENRNQPLITEQVITYKLSKRLGATPKPYVLKQSIVFAEGGKFRGQAQLISPELGEQLFNGLTPSNTMDDYVDITVELEFKGHLSATKTPFATGVYSYPIRAYRSDAQACTNGYLRFPDPLNACGYVGQQWTQVALPPQPACCPAPGAAGC